MIKQRSDRLYVTGTRWIPQCHFAAQNRCENFARYQMAGPHVHGLHVCGKHKNMLLRTGEWQVIKEDT